MLAMVSGCLFYMPKPKPLFVVVGGGHSSSSKNQLVLEAVALWGICQTDGSPSGFCRVGSW